MPPFCLLAWKFQIGGLNDGPVLLLALLQLVLVYPTPPSTVYASHRSDVFLMLRLPVGSLPNGYIRSAPAHIRPASGTSISRTDRYKYQSDIRLQLLKDRAQTPHIPQPTNDTMWDWLGLMGLVVPIPGSNI